MARKFELLTALKVAREKRPGLHPDGLGLYLRVTEAGTSSWLFRFRFSGGRHDMGLGPTRLVSLKEARELAQAARKKLHQGINPLSERQAGRQDKKRIEGISFAKAAELYVNAQRPSWSNPKHAQQWQNTLKDYASKTFGTVPVAQVDTHHIIAALRPIWSEKTETASRVRMRIEAVLDWAKVAGYRSGDNPARWAGHLDKLLPSPAKVRTRRHFASLPWVDLPAFMVELREQEGNGTKALKLAILTACRSGEVRGAQWGEFDLQARLWTIPGERMKAKVEHRVPLSDAALEIIQTLPKSGNYLFPGVKKDSLISDMTLTQVLRRMEVSVTVHGFRSTFRDWAADATNYPRQVCEHALAHKLPDKVEAAYLRTDYLEKRASLMADWAKFCGGIDEARA